MKKKLILIILLIIVVLIAGIVLVSPFINISIKNENVSKAQWKEDITYLGTNLPKKHINLFFKIKPQDFNDSIAKLQQDVDKLDSNEIQVRLMSIIASVGNAHTDITNFPSNFQYPLNMEWFKEGLFVVGVSSKYDNALGCRVKEINGVPIENIINEVNTLVPHENEFLLKWKSPILLTDPKVLRHFGITKEVSKNQNIVVTLIDQDNKEIKIDMLPEKNSDTKWAYSLDKIKNKPLYLSSKEGADLKYDENDKIIYYRFDNTSQYPTSKQLSLLKTMLEEKKAAKLVIDIRNNEGGMYLGNSELVNMIIKSSYFNTKGRLFVVTGIRTFSSGLLYALEFKNRTNAIFYGEPTGSKPSHYGNTGKLVLPNSKLTITYATKYFDEGNGDALVPDNIVEGSIKDYLNGIDLVVEKIKGEYK